MYLSCDVDDVLYFHHNADAILWQLHQPFPLKVGFGNPDIYLDVKLCKTRLHNGVWAFTMSPIKYVHEAARNCKAHLAANYNGRYRLPNRAENPFKVGYDPELDAASYFQTIIIILRWMIELGRI